MGRMRLRPDEVRDLTLPEVCLYLDDDVSKPYLRGSGAGPVFNRPGEAQEYARWYRSLTLADRIRLARERY